jgi:Uma2 family endonuclease
MSLSTLNRPLRIPADAYTLNGFRRWMLSPGFPRRGKVSFVAGEIEVDMNAEDVLAHADPKSAIARTLLLLDDVDNLGRIMIDSTRLVNKVADLSVEPDILLCRWEAFTSGRVTIQQRQSRKRSFSEIVGSPDLVVEVLSRSSIRKDTKVLPQKYYEAGVVEYWIVDCRAEETFKFEVLQRSSVAYEIAEADAEGFIASTAIPYRFRLTRARDPLGLWKYRLEHRAL